MDINNRPYKYCTIIVRLRCDFMLVSDILLGFFTSLVFFTERRVP